MKTVLVIEDDLSLARMAELNLTAEGYEVMRCSDGEMALSLLDKLIPDLVLLDLKLPGVSGWEVLAHLREDERLRRVPVVVLSAFAHARDKQQAWAAGANEYLVKPFGIAELISCVGRLT